MKGLKKAASDLILRGTKNKDRRTRSLEGIARTRVEISDCQSCQGIQNRTCTEE